MNSARRQGRQGGFTLVEAIIVIVITGIVAGMVAIFIRVPVQSQAAIEARADMADAADLALRRMSRELRLALPNTVTLYNNRQTIQFLLTKTGARYIAAGNLPPPALLPLDFVSQNTGFDLVGAPPTGRQAIVAGDYIAVGNTNVAPRNAYLFGAGADNISRVAGVNGTRITLQQNRFVSPEPQFPMFQVVTGKVTYVCTPGPDGVGTLRRFFNRVDLSAGLGAPGTGAVLTDKIAGCLFDNTALPGQNAGTLITLVLSLQHANGERAQLVRQTQLDNPL